MVAATPTPASRSPLWLVAGAAAATVITKLPVFLLAGLASLIRADLPLTESRLGLGAAGFFATTAISSVPGGRLAERIGPRRVIYVAGAIAATTMAGIALAQEWWHLLLTLVLGGIANGLAETATNLAIAKGIRGARQGLAFGIKQSAAPMTTLLAGLAIPLLGLTLGWRWAYGVAALLAIAVTASFPFDNRVSTTRTTGRFEQGSPTPALVVIAVGFGFGTAAATALAAFLVDGAIAIGISLNAAGLLLAASSLLGIIGRLMAGWFADRRGSGHLRVVILLLLAGSAGSFGLMVGTPVTTSLGALVGFGVGWSWTGLLNFAIARINPNCPAASTGVLLFGAASGASAGPLTFGFVVEATSYSHGWAMAGVWMLLGAVLIEKGRRMVLSNLAR